MKVGLVGFGFMGKAFMHSLSLIKNYYKKSITDIEVKGVITSSLESAKKIEIERYGFQSLYENYNEMLADKEINAVYIASPNKFHFDQIIQAMESSKNILCDKPLVLNANESDKILKSTRNNLILNTMFEYRNFPAIRCIKELINQGEIGEIIHFKMSYLHGSYLDLERPITWRLSEGGGALNDLGPHIIDLCNYLLGSISEVKGFKKNHIDSRPNKLGSKIKQKVLVDDYASCICKLEDGSTGILDVSRLSSGSIDELTLVINGSKGTLKWNLQDLNFFTLLTDRGENRIFAKNDFNGLADFPPEKVSHGWLRAHCHTVYQFLSMCSGSLQKDELSNVATFSDWHNVQLVLESFKDYNSFFK